MFKILGNIYERSIAIEMHFLVFYGDPENLLFDKKFFKNSNVMFSFIKKTAELVLNKLP